MPAYIEYPFADAITLTRASAKLDYDTNGVVASVAQDIAAFGYNGKDDGSDAGLSIHPAVQQFFSNVEDVTLWEDAPSRCTWGDEIDGPPGPGTMVRLIPNSEALGHNITISFTTDVRTRDVSFSVYCKPGGYNQFDLVVVDQQNSTSRISALVNLSSKTVSLTSGGTGTAKKGILEELADGVFRVTLSGRVTTQVNQTSAFINIIMRNLAGAASFAGDLTSGVYFGLPNFTFHGAGTAPIGSGTTRAVDKVALVGLTPWFLTSGQTMKFLIRLPYPAGPDADQVIYRSTDGSDDNSIRLYNPAGTNNIKLTIVAATVSVADMVIGTFTNGAVTGIAIVISGNLFRGSVNGGATVSDTVGDMPTGLTVGFLGGDDSDGAQSLNGHVLLAENYPVVLDADATATLSTVS